MKHLFLDTNILIRFLTNDDNIQSPLAYKVFEKATKQEFILVISPIVIAECTWVLQMNRYGYSKEEISNILRQLILSPGIKMLEEELTLNSLSNFSKHNVDFIDAYLASFSLLENKYPIITWNKKDFKQLDCEFYSPENLL